MAQAYKASLSLISRDVNGNTLTTTISNVNPTLMDADTTEEVLTNMENLDKGMRQINNLTTNMYVDTYYVRTYNLTEIAGG